MLDIYFILLLKKILFYFLFRLRLQNQSQEVILRVRRDKNFNTRHYDQAIDLFLMEYPDGELRVSKCHLSRYSGHACPNRLKRATVTIDIDIDNEANLLEILSNKWTSSDSSEAGL